MLEQRRPKRQRKSKPKWVRRRRFHYNVDDPPCMTFRGIVGFLGEQPLLRKTATTWSMFDKIFDLLWGRDDPAIKRGGGWTQRYRQGYHRALDLLFDPDCSSDSPDSLSHRLSEKVRTMFEYHCTCFPATSLSKWIAPCGGSIAWLAFRRDGSQDGHATSPDEYPENDNSWAWIRMSFKRDRMFSVSVRDIVMTEAIEELIAQRRIRRFQSYDGGQRTLYFYQDDQSARASVAELKSAKEQRRRKLERENAKPKPYIVLQEVMRARELENQRRCAEEARELRESSIRSIKRIKMREEEERRVEAQENYRMIKERFTPAQIFHRKFPRGRQSTTNSEDVSGPLSFHNLRKAVKRGWWQMEE